MILFRVLEILIKRGIKGIIYYVILSCPPEMTTDVFRIVHLHSIVSVQYSGSVAKIAF
jgi:hypothetical protein